MKEKLAVVVIFLIILFSSLVWANEKECFDCTEQKPCQIEKSAGDGCNINTFYVWCKDGKWYSSGVATTTLMMCGPLYYEIDNPFERGLYK